MPESLAKQCYNWYSFCAIIVDREARKWMSSSNFTWRTIEFYWNCLQEHGWEVMYRNRNDPKAAVLLKFTPIWVTTPKIGNQEHTAHPAGSSTGWTMSFSSDSHGLISSRQLCLVMLLLGRLSVLRVVFFFSLVPFFWGRPWFY